MRGLPFRASKQQIAEFFTARHMNGGAPLCNVNEQNILIEKSGGQLTGHGLVIFNTEQEAAAALNTLNRQKLESRFLELSYPSMY